MQNQAQPQTPTLQTFVGLAQVQRQALAFWRTSIQALYPKGTPCRFTTLRQGGFTFAVVVVTQPPTYPYQTVIYVNNPTGTVWASHTGTVYSLPKQLTPAKLQAMQYSIVNP